MDIRMYFQKIRETERTISEPYTVVISQETSEGGKAGRSTEVSRITAAHLIVEGKVRLASDAEKTGFYKDTKDALSAAEEERMAGKIQLTVISEQASRAMKQRSEKG